MRAIFFDLETTDRNPIGQILNYCFISVDSKFQSKAILEGQIKIGRLQLPDVDAILANRVDVLEHQRESEDREDTAMQKIASFISEQIVASGGKVYLIGYNSTKFDLLHLRTSMIRNGLNPYFGGKVLYRDLLSSARYLSSTCSDFPRCAGSGGGSDTENRLSLRLEALCHEFGILSGGAEQTHFSTDDVKISIELAKIFKSRFNHDVLDHESYQIKSYDHSKFKGHVLDRLLPEYDLSKVDHFARVPVSLLDYNYRSALWIDLNRYSEKEGSKSISYFNMNGGEFVWNGEFRQDSDLIALADQARLEFRNIKVTNFFAKSTCDIEQDIYRLDFDGVAALKNAIWDGDSTDLQRISSRDAKVLLLRWKLTNGKLDTKLAEVLSAYALYRYGGKAQMVKQLPEDLNANNVECFHRTFADMFALIEERKANASKESLSLLSSLKEFLFAI